MGSSSQQTQSTQQSSTQPWLTGQTVVNGILSLFNPLLANSGLNPSESSAVSQLTQNAQAGNPYAAQIGANASSLLNGGGATNEAGMLSANLQNFTNEMKPLASNINYDPTQTPGVAAALQAIQNQVTNSVDSQFAGAGRDLSGANQMAYGSGIAQAEAPLLLGQYNQNIQNQQAAAQNVFNAGNTTANTLAGEQQQAVTNQEAGTQAATAALTAQNYGPTAMLAAQQLAQSIPTQNLGMLANIGIPIAGLGSQTSGSGDNTTTTNPSLLSMLSGVGGLFSASANGTSAATGMGQAAANLGSGLTGLFAV
jgi:hypothetical protein